MVNFLLEQKSEYIKYPYLLCLWDIQVKHRHLVIIDWLLRNVMSQGKQNVVSKLGLMTLFMKALNPEKPKTGVLDSSNTRPHFLGNH